MLLKENLTYTIHYDDYDFHFTDVLVPWQSDWDFRLAAYDTQGDTLAVLNYGDAPSVGGPIPLDNCMERRQEDAVFVNVTNDPPGRVLWTDQDDNDYFQDAWLLFKIKVKYDSTFYLFVDLYARDVDSNEIYLGPSPTFELDYENNDILTYVITEFPGSHSLWDFRLEVYPSSCWDQCPISVVPYGVAANWTDVPMERWNEDEDLNTVFLPNPIHALNDDFFWDMDDALDAVPWGSQDGAYVPVTLQHLGSPVGGVYYLTGDYVNIRDFPSDFFPPPAGDEGAPHLPVPASTDGSFPYLRDQPGFDAVMAYFHITSNQEYLQDLGFDNVCNRPIGVDVDALNGIDNAQYLARTADTGKGFLLFGDGGTDNAEDADVILHEYCHAIVDNIAPWRFSVPQFGQTKAIVEGTADYWACSWADSMYPSSFPSAYFAEWDARATQFSPSYVRRVNTGKTILDSTGNPYEDSEIWSQALWNLKSGMGKRVTDSLILRAVEIVHAVQMQDPEMDQVAFAMIRADSSAYSAAHAIEIGQEFLDREIILCVCSYQGDINADWFLDASDLAYVIDIVFFGGQSIQDPTCPATRADFNNDGFDDALDLALLIDHVFFGQPGPTEPC